MKIRNGFVSNSSSSSFIIGIGKVTNLEKLKAFIAKKHRDIDIVNVYALKDQDYLDWHIDGLTTRNDQICLLCEYSGDEVSFPLNGLKDEEFMAIVNIHNDEGDDGEFGVRSQSSYYGVPITAEYFEQNGQAVYLALNEKDHGISEYTRKFGCKRNG